MEIDENLKYTLCVVVSNPSLPPRISNASPLPQLPLATPTYLLLLALDQLLRNAANTS